MAKHLYLPKLTKDANVKEPTRSGHWDRHGRRILRAISKGILVDEQARVRGVSSVPDAWARPLIFYSAIRPDSPHPLRSRMVQEWRGLMSLIALHEVQQYPLEFVPVPLVDGVFASALERLSPPPVQLEPDQAYDFTDVMLLRYGETAIGALSPLTLVYTAADYPDALKDANLNLADEDGFLQPPRHDEEKRYVAEWLLGLQKKLNAQDSPILDRSDANDDRAVVSTINGLIDTWITELRADLNARGDIDAPFVSVRETPVEPRTSWPALDRYRVYEALLHPLQREEDREGEHHSDLLLEAKRQRSDVDSVVVITERLLRKDRRVWRAKRLSHLGGDANAAIDTFFREASGRYIDQEDLGKFNARWIRPETYFLTDTLVHTRSGDALLAEGERALNEGGRYLLPFRKTILDFFGPNDIRATLKPRFTPDDRGVKFSFHLPVGGETIKIEKYYSRKDPGPDEGRAKPVAVPALEIFPDYLDEYWRRYYVFNGHRDSVVVRPVVYGNVSVVPQEQTGDVGAGATRRRVEISEITGDRAFPDGLEIQSARDGGEYWGLILLGPPDQKPESLAHTWTVGIDFGTSNTNVYRQKEGEDKARPWTFDFSRHIRPLTQAPAQEREFLLESFFLPDRPVQLPIPTGLRVFEDGQKNHPLLDYFIYFNSTYQPSSRVKTDIKWETDEKDRQTEFFLESLLILILIELVSRRAQELKLRCSYPKAFSDTLLKLFQGEWKRVISRVCEDDRRVLETKQTADDIGKKIEIREVYYEKEGVASGEYFASPRTIERLDQQADTAIAAICLDVGGGTTDISIWSRNHIVYDASVMLAGKQISDFLRKMPRLREMLFSPEAAVALDETKKEPPHFAARLNLVLKHEEDRVREMLNRHGTRSDITLLRQMITLEFGAIAFYVAALLKAAHQTKEGRGVLDIIAQNGISMHWGGNAAKLITWVDFGTYDEQGIASFMLNVAFYQALQDLEVDVNPDALYQRQSPGHKSEASGGLVVLRESGNGRSSPAGGGQSEMDAMPPQRQSAGGTNSEYSMDDNAGSSEGIVSGENILLSDGHVRHFDLISEKSLYTNGRTEFDQTSLDRLTRFVDIINFFGVRKGVFTENMRIPIDRHANLIRRKMKSHFVSAEREAPGSRLIEPVFIAEIKLLQKALIDHSR